MGWVSPWGGSSVSAISDLDQAITIEEQATDATLAADDLSKRHKVTAAATITLPPSSGLSAGDWLEVEKDTTDAVTVEGDGSDTIEYGGNSAAASITDGTAYPQSLIKLVWDGSVWRGEGGGYWA